MISQSKFPISGFGSQNRHFHIRQRSVIESSFFAARRPTGLDGRFSAAHPDLIQAKFFEKRFPINGDVHYHSARH
jgi:hypothetical protein